MRNHTMCICFLFHRKVHIMTVGSNVGEGAILQLNNNVRHQQGSFILRIG